MFLFGSKNGPLFRPVNVLSYSPIKHSINSAKASVSNEINVLISFLLQRTSTHH